MKFAFLETKPLAHMSKKISLIFVLILIASCGSIKKHNASLGAKFSTEALHEDIDFTYKKLQRVHPRLYQYIAKEDLDRKFDSLKKSIDTPLDAKQFYAALTPVVSEVRQGHITSNFPKRRFTKKERKALNKTELDFFELETKYIEDRLWITRTGPKDSLLIGSQVVAVGTETIANLFSKYRKTFSPDGYNTTFQNTFIANNFTAAYNKDKGHRDSIALLLMQNDSVFVKQFKRHLKDSSALKPKIVDTMKVVEKKRLSKTEKKAEKAKRKKRRKRNKKYGFIASRDQFTRNFKFIDSASRIGFIKIRSWGNGSHKEFFEESFTKLDSAKAQHLIIDLRDNPGGQLDQIHNFYSYLTDTEHQFINPAGINTRLPNIKNFYGRNSNVLSVAVQTLVLPYLVVDNLYRIRKTAGKLQYHFKESKTSKPNPLNFKGKIYVLINGGSFSASATLASKLHGTKRAVFIGEETGGAYNGTVAGFYKYITLPNTKITLRIGLLQIETPHLQEPDGYGVKPDFIISPTVADFLANRDTELEYTLDMIKKEM